MVKEQRQTLKFLPWVTLVSSNEMKTVRNPNLEKVKNSFSK
jgi:hypothetical protein